MLSLIMSSSRIHYLRLMEVNKEMLGYIISIGWWLLIAMVVTLVCVHVWYRANSNRPAALSEPEMEVRDLTLDDAWSDF